MRKTSKYATKQKMRGSTFNGAAWANVIQRCRPYTDEDVVPGWNVGATNEVVTDCAIRARMAFADIKDGKGSAIAHDVLAHCMGVSYVRAVDIAGQDDDQMLPIIKAATNAVRRMGERHTRTGAWGWDGPALQEVDAGLDVYEAILRASSPAQMSAAVDACERIIALQH